MIQQMVREYLAMADWSELDASISAERGKLKDLDESAHELERDANALAIERSVKLAVARERVSAFRKALTPIADAIHVCRRDLLRLRIQIWRARAVLFALRATFEAIMCLRRISRRVRGAGVAGRLQVQKCISGAAQQCTRIRNTRLVRTWSVRTRRFKRRAPWQNSRRRQSEQLL
jgi:hypothetical protein